MEFNLYQAGGYSEAIMSLRMSKGKFYSWQTACDIQDLAYAVTDQRGFLVTNKQQYNFNVLATVKGETHGKITGVFGKDVKEFERLLQLTFDNAMGEQKHHTLMKYIDVSFFTEGLHRGAQDDLDAHAIAFNNRITRFSTRLAEISETKLSEWYQDKVITFYDALNILDINDLPGTIVLPEEDGGGTFKLTPFGYVLERFAQVPAKNGLAKDTQRGLMPLGMESNGLWKTDLFNLRYVYKMRSKLTKANPELKEGMEQLADQIEKSIPVFGPYFRKELTDSGTWEHMNKVRTITSEEFQQFKKWQKGLQEA